MKYKIYYFRKKGKNYKGRFGPYRAQRVEQAWTDFVRDRFALFGYEPIWKEMKDRWEYYCA